jgi:sulfur carrier protein
MVELIIAGVKKDYDDGLTVLELVNAEKVETPEYVTVAVNEEFVENADFSSKILKNGDNVEFLYFMGGGR